VIVLVALGVGLWYNRRRLATPFAHVVGALQRVAAGHYDERLDENQPEEFGRIAHGVNQMRRRSPGASDAGPGWASADGAERAAARGQRRGQPSAPRST